ncbi:MAG: AsnC family transcriptional regulator [Thermoproteus sp.]|nr:AsnC family transcriptional regulator [Thermoproteus sp.]
MTEKIEKTELPKLDKLRELLKKAKPLRVYRVYGKQSELGISPLTLKKFRDAGYITSGRGYVDITEDAVKALEGKLEDAVVLVKAEPQALNKIMEVAQKLPVAKVMRTVGEYDVVVMTTRLHLQQVTDVLGKVEGVKGITTLVALS